MHTKLIFNQRLWKQVGCQKLVRLKRCAGIFVIIWQDRPCISKPLLLMSSTQRESIAEARVPLFLHTGDNESSALIKEMKRMKQMRPLTHDVAKEMLW